MTTARSFSSTPGIRGKPTRCPSPARAPSRIVDRLDEAVLHITDVAMATMVLARIEEAHDGRWKLSWTNAGHPPPLLISHDSLADYLADGHGILLGTGAHKPRTDATTLLPPGSTLLLYTDGLIEEPGLTRPQPPETEHLAHRPLASFTDQLLNRVRPVANDDDVALLALRVPTRT